MTRVTLKFEDFLEIKETKFRYFRAVDQHDWELLDTVFTEDARFYGYGFAIRDQLSSLKEKLSQNLTQVRSQHMGVNPEMTVKETDSSGSAIMVHTRWSFSDELRWPETYTALNSPSLQNQIGIKGSGYYEDEVMLTPRGWRISLSRHYRTFLDALTTTGSVPLPIKARELDKDWL